MSRLLRLVFFLLALPTLASAAITVPWSATSTTQGWVGLNKINGAEQTAVANNFFASSSLSTSTFAGTGSFLFGTRGLTFFNTADTQTNYEQVRMGWAANVFNIIAERGGSGTVRGISLLGSNTSLNIGSDASIASAVVVRRDSTTVGQLLAVVSSQLNASSGIQSVISVLTRVNQTGTAGFRGLWVSPFISAIGSAGGYLIDTGTNTAVNGSGTHTRLFTVDTAGIASTTNLVISGITNGSTQCLQQDSTGLVTGTGLSCGAGGGSGGGTWSTTTSQVSGRLINYPNNTSDIVVVGSNATTSAEYWFDPNTIVNGALNIFGWRVATSTTVCAAGCQYTSIQTAINAGWNDILVKDGVYSEQITLGEAKTRIRGENLNSIIQCNGATQTPCVDTNSLDEIWIDGITIRETNAALVGIGFDMSDSSLSKLTNSRINNFATSTTLTDTTSNTFYDLIQSNTFFNPKTCIEFSGTQANANWVYNNRCRPMAVDGGYGIYLHDARGITVTGDFEGTSTAFSNIGIFVGTTSREITFINPWVEAIGKGVLVATGSKRISFMGGSITSNGIDIEDVSSSAQWLNVSRTGTTVNDLVPFTVSSSTATSTISGALSFTKVGSADNPVVSSDDPDDGFYWDSSDNFVIGEDGSAWFSVGANGQLRSHLVGTAALPAYTFSADLDTGFYKTASGDVNSVGITTGGSLVIQFDTASTTVLLGNLGIGTSTPWAKLSVEGGTSTLGTNAIAGYYTGTTTATSTFGGGFTFNGTGLVFQRATNNLLGTGWSITNNGLGESVGNFSEVNTGQGANELYSMDQNVRTSDAVTFESMNVTNDAGAAQFTASSPTLENTFPRLIFTLATGTSATTTNSFSTTASSTNLFGAITRFGTLLVNGSSTLQNFTFINATGSSATTTNLFSTTASSTNLFSAAGRIGLFTLGNVTGSTQCLQADTNGLVSGAGAACGSGSGGGSLWATTSNLVGIYPSGGTTIGVVIGRTSTTTNSLLEVNATSTAVNFYATSTTATSTFGPTVIGHTQPSTATSTITAGDVQNSLRGCINMVTHSGGVYATSSFYMIGATVIGETNACR